MLLYAQIDKKTNQIKNIPSKLPDRWTTPEGVTITHFNKLPNISLQAFDWLPVIYDELTDGAMHNSIPIYDKINHRFIFEAIPQDINILIKESERRIDEAASFICEKYISQGIGQDCRYMIKREQAIAFLIDVPENINKYQMIKREAEFREISYDSLAFLIVETANNWINLAAEIEALRCSGKERCKNAINITKVIQFRDATILALEQI